MKPHKKSKKMRTTPTEQFEIEKSLAMQNIYNNYQMDQMTKSQAHRNTQNIKAFNQKLAQN